MNSALRLLNESLFENAADGVLFGTTTGTVMHANQAACRMLGRSEAELIRIGRQGFVVDGSALTNLLATRRERGSITGPLEFRRADGTTFPVEVTSSLVSGPSGEQLACTTFRDITERRRRDAALRESEKRQRDLLENLDAGVVVHASDTSIIQGNRKAGVLLGLTPDQMRGITAADPGWRFVRDDGTTMPISEYPVACVRATKEPVVDQVLGIDRPRTGDRAWVLVNAFPEFDDGRALREIVVTFVDITRRKEAEDALRASDARLRTLAANVPGVLYEYVLRPDGTSEFLYVGPKCREILEVDEQAMMADASVFWSLVHPEDVEQLHVEDVAANREGRNFAAECRIVTPTGRLKWVSILSRPSAAPAGGPVPWSGIIIDITERRALQEQLGVKSRLAAMGTLVAGVAHEINNPLSAELADQGHALEVVRELRERLRGESAHGNAEVRALEGVVEALEEAQEAGQRIAQIVKDLTAFGQPDPNRRRIRLSDVVQGAMRWLPSTVARTASIVVDDRGALDVMVAPGQIEQVVANLLTNAARATTAERRNDVTVRIGPGEPGMARLEVIDHGCGIDPAIRARIFDPFFTTRPVGAGRGSGLGLAVSHVIATSHRGVLSVESEVGKGSTFRLELPVAPAET
jgi:PAS domain S-box-containing protein